MLGAPHLIWDAWEREDLDERLDHAAEVRHQQRIDAQRDAAIDQLEHEDRERELGEAA